MISRKYKVGDGTTKEELQTSLKKEKNHLVKPDIPNYINMV